MKRRLSLTVALMLVTGFAWAQAPAAAPDARPVANVAEKIKDFGVVPKGETLHAVFVVKNDGAAPLEITNVRPTCGCTVANFDRTIPPGGSGKIEAQVDTESFNGPISKAIVVFTSDPASPQINLVVKAEVRSFVEVMPRSLLRFTVLQGESTTEKVTLVPHDDSSFKVLSADVGGGPYKVSFRELPASERVIERKGSQWEVTVTVPADAPEGMLNHKIALKTTAPKASEVVLSVSGVVRPIVQVIPGIVNFGNVPGGTPVGRNIILINNRQGAELQLSDVKVDNPNFATEVIPLQDGQRFQVAVSLQAGVGKGAQKGTLTINTNDPARKIIQVPIEAIVQ